MNGDHSPNSCLVRTIICLVFVYFAFYLQHFRAGVWHRLRRKPCRAVGGGGPQPEWEVLERRRVVDFNSWNTWFCLQFGNHDPLKWKMSWSLFFILLRFYIISIRLVWNRLDRNDRVVTRSGPFQCDGKRKCCQPNEFGHYPTLEIAPA